MLDTYGMRFGRLSRSNTFEYFTEYIHRVLVLRIEYRTMCRAPSVLGLGFEGDLPSRWLYSFGVFTLDFFDRTLGFECDSILCLSLLLFLPAFPPIYTFCVIM